MKTILITGAGGFIGSHLAERLKKEFNLILIDNFSTGKLENLSFITHRNHQIISHDVCEDIQFRDKIYAVLHFASPASPIDYLKLPIETLKVNALGTLKMLELAKKHKSRFLLASTSEVYGDPLEHPQKESYWGNVNPIGPRGVYDEAKRYAEALVMAFKSAYRLETRIVRIFNTYGPRMRQNDGRAVPTFINQALKGKDLTIAGDGSQTRSFCYVDDTVSGIMRLLASNYSLPVNIGNPLEMTIKDCAQRIIKLIGSRSKIFKVPLPQDDPKIRQPDISLAKRVLKWEPKFSFESGIKKTIQWFKEEI